MNVPAPHFLLFSEASDGSAPGENVGRWRFVLEAVDGTETLEAADEESETSAERLELLAIIRGLEALDQPSRVTLVTRSRHVSRGMRFGLEQWRENDWQWERFGQMTPVKNGDLWQRIDHALKIHRVECRAWKLESADDLPSSAPHSADDASDSVWLKSSGDRILRVDSGKSHRSSSAAQGCSSAAGNHGKGLLGGITHWFSNILRSSPNGERAA